MRARWLAEVSQFPASGPFCMETRCSAMCAWVSSRCASFTRHLKQDEAWIWFPGAAQRLASPPQKRIGQNLN